MQMFIQCPVRVSAAQLFMVLYFLILRYYYIMLHHTALGGRSERVNISDPSASWREQYTCALLALTSISSTPIHFGCLLRELPGWYILGEYPIKFAKSAVLELWNLQSSLNQTREGKSLPYKPKLAWFIGHSTYPCQC